MKIIKLLFSSARNAILSVLCAVIILAAVGVGIAFATEAMTDAGPIDRAAALRFALADAGLTESEITVTKQKLDRDKGKNQYEIEFFTADYAYEYEIDASTGAVAGVSIEALFGRPAAGASAGAGDNGAAGGNATAGDNGAAGGNAAAGDTAGTAAPEQPQEPSQTQPDARQSGSQNQGQTGQTGTQGQSGQTGSQGQTTASRPSTDQITLDAAKAAALADAGVSASDAVFTKARLDWDDGIAVYEIEFYTSGGEYEYELSAADGAVLDREVELFQTASSGGDGSYIGVDQAKEIAAVHAGCRVSSVVFTKAKLERDDGVTEYEIEFYNGCMEHEYCIDAFTGAILDYECESHHYDGCPHGGGHHRYGNHH